MLARCFVLLGCISFQMGTMFALVAEPLPLPQVGINLERMIPPSQDAFMLDQVFGGVMVAGPPATEPWYIEMGKKAFVVLAIILALYIAFSEYRSFKKSGNEFSRRQVLSIISKLLILFIAAYFLMYYTPG